MFVEPTGSTVMDTQKKQNLYTFFYYIIPDIYYNITTCI